MNLIVKGLYLGDMNDAQNLKLFKTNNISCVVNCSVGLDNFLQSEGITYLNLYYQDILQQSLNDNNKLYEAVYFINKCLDNNQNVLVHCHAGISRSASVVIAFLMSKYKWSFKYAYLYVKNKRAIIQPNESFIRQLQLIHEDYFSAYSPHINKENSYMMILN